MTAPQHAVTAERDRISVKEKLGYASGGMTFALGYNLFSALAFPIFNLTMGLNPAWIGIMLGLGRFWDAMVDPFIGNMSDNTRSRYGRRRPYILLGSVLCAIVFPLIWFVPTSWSPACMFAYLLIASMAFYGATALYGIPWLSLGYELTPDYHERTRLQAWKSYATTAFGLCAPWIYRFVQSDFFSNPLSGMRWTSLAVAVAFVLFALPTFLFCRERFAENAKHQEQIPLKRALSETLKNKPFLVLVLGLVMTNLMIWSLTGSMRLYLNTYYVFGGDGKAGAEMNAYAGTFEVIINILTIPILVKMSTRHGKIFLVRFGMICGIIAMGLSPLLLTPKFPYLQLVCSLIMAPAMQAFWLVIDPMKADCADYDEWRTGLRREGSYAAVSTWIEKVGITIALIGSGFLLQWIGFDVANGLKQNALTLDLMRWLYAGIPIAAFAIGLTALRWYSLSEARMLEIRLDLETRRGVVN